MNLMNLCSGVPWNRVWKLYLFVQFLGNDAFGYNWGHTAILAPESAPEKDVIIIPDPDRLAQSDGIVEFIEFWSTETDKFFKLIILRSAGHSSTDTQPYTLELVSEFIHAKHNSVNNVQLKDTNMNILKGDVIGFLVFDKMPIPYENVTCVDSQRTLISSIVVGEYLKIHDILHFSSTEGCRRFSYVINVVDKVSTTQSPTAITKLHNVTPTTQSNKPGAENLDKIPESCAPGNCDNYLPPDENNDDNLYKYVVFGPLILLWIIVAVICSVKLKPRCLRKIRPVPTESQALAAQPTRPRYGRVTLSRLPPSLMNQPKPMVDMTPHAMLPPYSGVDPQPQRRYNIPGVFLPAYPPPTYTPQDTKTGENTEMNTLRDNQNTRADVELDSHEDILENRTNSRNELRVHVSPNGEDNIHGNENPETEDNDNSNIENHVPPRAVFPRLPQPQTSIQFSGETYAPRSCYPSPPPSYAEATDTHM